MNHHQIKVKNSGDLQVLVQTARAGSITAAACALGVTPAAASAALKRVETQLGVRLFERSTRAMRLTPAGTTMLEYASRAFDLIAEGEAQVAEGHTELVGLVRLAAPSDLARSTLMPWLDEFLGRHPDVQLALGIGDRTLDLVRDQVDVALRYGELADSRLVARRMLLTRPVVVASPDYLARHPAPQSPLDLAQHNCLAYDRGGKPFLTWRFAKDGHWTEVRVSGNRTVDDASIARHWALSGAGILLKSPIEQAQDMAQGRLVRLLADWQTEEYPLNVLLPSGRFLPRRTRALVEFISGKFEALGRELARVLSPA